MGFVEEALALTCLGRVVVRVPKDNINIRILQNMVSGAPGV